MTRNKVLLHIKDFLKILFLKLLTILITKMHGLTHFLLDLLPTHGFSTMEKNLKKKKFTNWFQEWWLFFEATQNIFCPQIRKSFDYFKVNYESFFLSGNNYSLSFCSQFRIPWILCWDFTTHNFLPSPFPQHLAREFKIKWWAAFKISQSQTFESIKEWLDSQKPKSKKPTKTKVPTWSHPLPCSLAWPQTPSKISFPSSSAHKNQEHAAKTLSQLADSDEDEEYTASSSAFQKK